MQTVEILTNDYFKILTNVCTSVQAYIITELKLIKSMVATE